MLTSLQLMSTMLMAFAVFDTVHSQIAQSVEGDHDNVVNRTDPSGAKKTGSRSVPTLQLVIVVTRHGYRAPVFTFPASHYKSNDSSVWRYGAEELTQNGRVQMHKLGEKFRSLYDGFMDRTYRNEDFKASSTLMSRTLQSAELFLAGLFPPTGFQVWNEHLLWQPVPVYPNFLDHFKMAATDGKVLCPRFKKAQIYSVMEFDKLYNSTLTSIIDYAPPYTGIDESHLLTTQGSLFREKIILILWESIRHLTENGYSLPAWANKIYPEPLFSTFQKTSFTLVAGSVDQIRYLEGELFQEIVGLMQSKASHCLSPDRRMVYYSGHDATIMVLLSMLGQPERYVNMGSALIYELHRHPRSGHHYVKVLYVNGQSRELEPEDINIQGCDSPCDLHLLMNITEKYYNITDWQEECRLTSKTV